MALELKVGTFQKSTGAAPVSQSITGGAGFTFEPKVLILVTVGVTALNTATAGYKLAMGFAHKYSSDQGSSAAAGQDAVSPTNTSQRIAAKALTMVQWGETTLCECDATFSSSDISVNVTTNDGNAYHIGYIVLGGSDITAAKVVSWASLTASGEKAVTGMGFQPTLIFNLTPAIRGAIPQNSVFADFCFGAITSQGAQGSANFRSSDNFTSQNMRSGVYGNGAIVCQEQGTVVARVLALLKAITSDGFTVYYEIADGLANLNYSMGVKTLGAGIANAFKPTSAAPASHAVDLFRAIRPKLAIALSDQKALHQATGGTAPTYFGFGVSDGVTSFCIALSDNYSGGASKCKSLMRNDKWFVKAANDTGAQDAVADTPTFSDNTITTSWSTNDAVAINMAWLAIGDAASAAPSPGGTSRPLTPSSMISAGPPAEVATTGRPQASPSSAAMPNDS